MSSQTPEVVPARADDVAGYAVIGAINIVVTPQIQTQINTQVAAGNLGPVTQTLDNLGIQGLGAQQRALCGRRGRRTTGWSAAGRLPGTRRRSVPASSSR